MTQVAYRLQNSVSITSHREKQVYTARFHKAKNAQFYVSSLRSPGGSYALNYLIFNTL